MVVHLYGRLAISCQKHRSICAAGYNGNPLLGQRCTVSNNEVNGNCYTCDQRGRESCTGGACRCKMNVEGPSCSTCRPGTFHLSPETKMAACPVSAWA
ncbi:hypothetical protein JOQ06_028137 [Pogonophryne albipinna]|uniref:Laminin EGF-like domain-containing protein n=1 Tax=Pogonophryne albipinna TaxID=1090488 RepID=A0AAD6AFR5_9TELE|nr:hypothetical protein JOQ06_028137 [Pogonophryne albipinna]